MAPPAASATARINAGRRSRAPRRRPASRAPRRSVWAIAGWLIGSILWWLLLWPLRTVVRGGWSLCRWLAARPARAALAALAIVAVLGSAYWFWFRNSSFVRVERVRVEGTTMQIDDINNAIGMAAAGMTTLNADAGTIADALARFPAVRGVELESDFPHGLVVQVDEMPPVALVVANGGLLPVAGDGRILQGIPASQLNLATIATDSVPANGMLSGDPLAQAEVLGAAPPELRPLAEEATMQSGGVVLRMRGGVELRFGSPADVADKWTAAAAVLADPKLHTAAYVDLSDPTRPAVGGDPTVAEEPTTEDLAGAPTTTTASTAATATTTATTTPATTTATGTTPATDSTAAPPEDAASVAPATDTGTSSASTGAVPP